MSETLTRPEFDARLASGELALTLVGMSNMGKSHWARRFEHEAGFRRISCDELIESVLGDELTELGYNGGIEDVAKWMGLPHEKRSPVNQRRYLDLETGFMRSIAGGLENRSLVGNTVIDTTGSIVHVDQQIRDRLVASSTIVYLESTPDMREAMFVRYIAEPKPVVWGELYAPMEGEKPKSAMPRCYQDLLDFRSQLYAGMAQVIMPLEIALQMSGPDEAVAYIRNALPTAA